MNIAGGGNHGKQTRNHKFLVKFIESGSVARKPGSGRPSKVTAEVRKIIEEAMRTDDETTAKANLESSVSLSALFLEQETEKRLE